MRKNWWKILKHHKVGEIPSPVTLKTTQAVIYTVCACFICFVLFILFSNPRSLPEKETETQTHLVSADEVVDPREIWINRVEKEAHKARQEAAEIRHENQLMRQRFDVMDEMYNRFGPGYGSQEPLETEPQAAKAQMGEMPSVRQSPPFSPPDYTAVSQEAPLSGAQMQIPAGPKILHLSLPRAEPQKRPTVDTYIPAGTYARAVLTSGVVASTSSTAQGDPHPIFIRLVDYGNLPRGFKGDLKDAVLIGACYGDLSSERAYCRLHKMAFTEHNGEVVEKKVEGWIVGEDGRPGLKGTVVDRAGEVARGALLSGILSGMAGFFKQQTTSSVYPVSPFGQTNALSTKEVLQGSAATGAGSALEKLADFTIRRAEALQPVILVNPGREVDVVFKEGVDLSESSVKEQLFFAGQNQREEKAKSQAQNHVFEMH